MIFLVQHFLENSARRLPEKVALICGEQRLTYKEINEQADQLASALIDIGIQRGDRVAILLDNSAESVIALFGILKAGAIFIMLSATMKAKKLNYILKDSSARALIIHSNKARIVQEALTNTPDLDHIIWCSAKDSKTAFKPATHNPQFTTNMSLSDILYKPYALCPIPYANRCIDLDLATIIYTSGSTGDPKGVICAHYNVISAARSISTYLENVENDIILNALPLSFDYGLYQVFMAFLFGSSLVLEKTFVFPYTVLERLVQEKVTGFPIVPTMAALLLQLEDLSKFDFSKLRFISNTAAALPVAYIRKLQRLFPRAKIFSMYGLTECKRVSYLPPEELDRRPESVGIPIPNTEVLIEGKNGVEARPGEVGELVIRGSNVMQGYWNDPETTARIFRSGQNGKERVLDSGDLFRKDEKGFLYFVARKDDLIKTKGERVSPKEIENILCELEGVAEAAVIGVPDEIYGHAIKALIVLNSKSDLSERTIMKYCTKNLEPFMIPRFIEFRDKLPITPSGKLNRKKV